MTTNGKVGNVLYPGIYFLFNNNLLTQMIYFLFFRYRLSEISFVLKAVATLIISMKKAPPAKGKFSVIRFTSIFLLTNIFVSVGRTAWEQLIGLYQYLVDCTTTTSPEVSRSLREALMQYTDLLLPPSNSTNITTNGLSSHC